MIFRFISNLVRFVAGIPTITRTFTVTSLTFAFLNALQILPSYYLYLDWYKVFHNWQIWRFVTSFFVIPDQPMQGLMALYMLYSYSRGLEENKFYLNIPDYAFYLSIVMPLIVIVSVLTQSHSLLENLLGAISFTWSRANNDQRVSFYFMTIEAKHLPIVTLGFKLLLEGPRGFFATLFGMAAAYFYSCIESRSLGPLYSYIVNTLGINVIKHSNTNRVGTIHTMHEVTDGYLPAPAWFRSIIYNIIGRPRSEQKKDGINSIHKTGTTASSTGYYKGSFQGKGHRLGN